MSALLSLISALQPSAEVLPGLALLSPKPGLALGDLPVDDGWSHGVYTLTPGVPGDSGSGFMTAGGKAVGTLSTFAIAPLPLRGLADMW